MQLNSPSNTTFVFTRSHRGQATIDIFGTRNLFRFLVNITRMPNNGRITEDSISRVVKPAVRETSSFVILPLFGILIVFTRNLKRLLVPNISIVAWPRCELVRTKVVLHGEYI